MNRNGTLEIVMVTTARVAFVGLWFVALMLIYNGLARHADGLSQAGLFAISIACVKLASGFISDPIDLALMGRVPSLLRAAPAKAFEILRAAFGLRLAAALTVAAAMMIAAPLMLEHRDAQPLMRYVAAAIVGEIVFRATLVVLQASERFRMFTLLEGLVQVGRFVAIAALWGWDLMRVDLVLAAHATASFIAAMIGFLLLPI